MGNKKEESFGVVSFSKNTNGSFLFCIVHHTAGHWAFPKGHKNTGESDQETAARELKEETGISEIKLLDNKFFIEEYTLQKNGILYDKSVKYFLGFTPSINTITPDEFKKEITGLKWVSYEEAKDLVTYQGSKKILDQAFRYLQTIRSPRGNQLNSI